MFSVSKRNPSSCGSCSMLPIAASLDNSGT
jgi:hypothetical protein